MGLVLTISFINVLRNHNALHQNQEKPYRIWKKFCVYREILAMVFGCIPLQRFPVQRFPLQRVYCSCRYTINTHKTLASKKSIVH